MYLTQQPPLRQRRKGVVTSTNNRIRPPLLQTPPIILANSHFHQQCKSQNKRGHQGTPWTGESGVFGVVPPEIDKQALRRTGRT